jgi:hypothetical protein
MHESYVLTNLGKKKASNGEFGGIQRSLIYVTNSVYTIRCYVPAENSFQPIPHECMKAVNLPTRFTRIPRCVYNGSDYPNTSSY